MGAPPLAAGPDIFCLKRRTTVLYVHVAVATYFYFFSDTYYKVFTTKARWPNNVEVNLLIYTILFISIYLIEKLSHYFTLLTFHQSTKFANHWSCKKWYILTSQTSTKEFFRKLSWRINISDIVMKKLEQDKEWSWLFHFLVFHQLQVQIALCYLQKNKWAISQHSS